MTGQKPFKGLMDNWDAQRKARVAEKTVAMENELDFAALCEALDLSQIELASALGRPHGAISQLERRTEMTVSDLRRVIEGMGGKLIVSAEFPDRTVSLGIGTSPQANQ